MQEPISTHPRVPVRGPSLRAFRIDSAPQPSAQSSTLGGAPQSLRYTYRSDGRLDSVLYPSQRTIGYSYDGIGRTVGIQDRTGGGAKPLVTSIDFDEWGQRKRLTFGSGAYSDWSTQDLGTHLKTWTIGYTTGGLGDPGNPRQYTYNPIEQLTKAGEWGPLQHDALGQLVHAEAPGMGVSSVDYAHDGFGNNISHRVQGTAGASFNNFDFPALATNQIPSMTTKGGLTGWSMNPQGRAIQIGTGTSTGRTLGLGWDGLGQLASVTSAAGTQRYAYAPTGLRVQVQDSLSPARNRRYAYSSGGLLMSEFTQAGWKRDVVYLGSEAVAEVDGAGVHELHNDHLGTPRIVTSRATRRIEGRQAFGPYGEVLAAQTEGYRPLTGYTGHLQTEDTGLIYMRGRYYSPAWHRFLNSDQGADPSTWNQVAYVGGSPFMAIDPSGMRLLWRRCTWTTIRTFDKDGNLTGSVTFDPVCIERIIPEAGDYTDGDLGGGGSPGEPQANKPPCVNGFRDPTPAEAQAIVDANIPFVGTRYSHQQPAVPGLNGHGDCSGILCAVFGNAGFPIVRSPGHGSGATDIVTGPSVRSVSSPMPGDIAYWSYPFRHVATYSGDGNVYSTSSSNGFDEYPASNYGGNRRDPNKQAPSYFRYKIPCK